MDLEFLLKLKKYIEEAELTNMWEYSGNIVDDKVLFKDKERMPKIYFQIKNLITKTQKNK